RLKIVIQCTGGHVATPHQGSHAIDIATDIQIALRGFDTRALGPSEPVSLVPAIFKSGSAGNVRPSEAELWFSLRNVLGPEKRQEFRTAITKYVEAAVSKYEHLDPKAQVEVTPIDGHPALANSFQSYEKVQNILEKTDQKTAQIELLMGGEDFAYYLELQGGVPGSAWMLGVWQPGTGGHHAPTFNPDESVFWKGVLFWLLLAYSD
ncbi:MAG: amidohydrolase, partial [Chloroflexi bacterium]|nr:amidohydrolase [Chloroflexota bacterium]